MKRQLMTVIGLVFFSLVAAKAQSNFSVTVDDEIVALDDYLRVTVTLNNCEGSHFTLDKIDGFAIAGRPSSQTSMSIINGKHSSSSVYTYLLTPKKVGKYIIGPFEVRAGDRMLKAEKLKITVVEQYAEGDSRRATAPPKNTAPETRRSYRRQGENDGNDTPRVEPKKKRPTISM